MIGYVCGITHKILYSNDSLDEDDPVAQNMNRLPVQIDGQINHENVDSYFARMAEDIREAKKNADFGIFFPHIGG
ncbi:MAG: CapA family protein [Ruminococcaceae bacterium]|nr:CapA family protein [Oscillospiraceae bacterium]